LASRAKKHQGITSLGGRRWRIRYEMPPDPLTGKRRQRCETFEGSLKEAVLYRAERILAAKRGAAISPSITVEELMRRWYHHYCAVRKKSVKEKRQKDVRSRIECHITPGLGHLELTRLTPYHIQVFVDGIDRAPRTVRGIYETLNMALRWAVKMQIVGTNPAVDIELPPLERTEIHALTEEEARRFLAAARDSRYHVLFVTALATGMRRGELLALRWQDVDFRRLTLHVRHTLQLAQGGFRLVPPKTASSVRALPLSPRLAALLRRHKEQQNRQRLLAGPLWQNHDLVFANEVGNPVDPDNLIKRYFKPLLEKASLPNIRFHDLRHTYATLMLERGVHVKVVAARLGHSREAFTLATYAHLTPVLEAGTAAVLDDIMDVIM